MRVEDLLRELVQNFEQSPASSSRVIRELLNAGQETFIPAALSALGQTRDSRGYRCLIGLLAVNDLLRKCLCDDSLNLSKAVAAARIGMQVDPTLARSLMQDCMRNGTRRSNETVRMLEILGHISEDRRMVPLLTRLLHHPDPRIRAEAALRIGRRGKRTQVWERCRTETDPRARADSIESLWGMEEQEVRRVLMDAARDDNNRVAGNALVGLHRLGETGSIGLTLQMAAHADPLFRATAAWVMGESGDPRFLATLGRMLADKDSRVRSRAFRSVSLIRRRLTESAILAVYLSEARRLDDGSRQLCVSVVDANGRFPAVTATGLLVSEDGQDVTAYEVERRPVPGTQATGFAIPRQMGPEPSSLERTLLECLARKRPGDPWAVARYGPDAAGETVVGDAPPPLRFTVKSAGLRETIENPSPSATPGSLLEATRCLLAGAALAPGERHLLLATSPPEAISLAREAQVVAAQARSQGVAIHVLNLSAEPAPALQELSGATGGRFLQVQTPEEAGATLARIYWGRQYQYRIRYGIEGCGEDRHVSHPTIRVQVHAEIGHGEDALTLA